MDNKNTTLSKEELAIQKKKAKEAKRAEIAKTLPKYTRGEEIFNAVSHIVGGALGIGALVVGIVFAALKTDKIGVMSMIIFGLSIMILYTMSAIYHFLFINKAKKVFRVFDHCNIYSNMFNYIKKRMDLGIFNLRNRLVLSNIRYHI